MGNLFAIFVVNDDYTNSFIIRHIDPNLQSYWDVDRVSGIEILFIGFHRQNWFHGEKYSTKSKRKNIHFK